MEYNPNRGSVRNGWKMNTLLLVLLLFVWLLGFFFSINAIVTARTAQGAVAWVVSLITVPFFALPLYLIFGQRKFYGYIKSRRKGNLEINHIARELSENYASRRAALPDKHSRYLVLEKLVAMPFTAMNSVELLQDGQQTFESIFKAIDSASDYIILQFYIVHDDVLGGELKNRLSLKSQEGVAVYFLYDGIGSYGLSSNYISELSAQGVNIAAFRTLKTQSRRFQINFRNHRKLVIVDGKVAFVGGINVGDEYVSCDSSLGCWRDTQVMLSGPSVQSVQLAFLEDWYWSEGTVPEFNWHPGASRSHNRVLVMPTGPADTLDTCALFFLHSINCAKSSLWIISPYFVPDLQVVSALQLAVLRGVKINIMLPARSDNLLVDLASLSYMSELMHVGVNFYRYYDGFLHQKIVLVDKEMAVVGTANVDNRSFRLNFELNVVVVEDEFAKKIHDMIMSDLEHCRLQTLEELENKNKVLKFAAKAARLLAPVL